MSLRALIDRLFYGGYEAARAAIPERVRNRYSRGSISIQDGDCLSEDDLQRKRDAGDKAMAALEARLN